MSDNGLDTHRSLPMGLEDFQIARDARGCQSWMQCDRRLHWIAVFLCALGCFSWFVPSASALIVINSPLDTTQPPPDDPGWNNVAGGLSPNYVYLGNGWALTAYHVARNSPLNQQLMNFGPSYSPNFGIIPNQGYSVPNPNASSMGLTALTDLYLVRLNGDPGLPSLTIASQALTTANIGTSVTIAGLGTTREPNTSVWSGHTGYYGLGQNVGTADYTKRWGLNQISDDQIFLNEGDPDLRHTISLDLSNETRDIVSMFTVFDAGGSYEAQVIGGDSGSAVFHKNGTQWELIGIVNTALGYFTQGQPSNFAPFGGATSFADLTFYRDEINKIMFPDPLHPTKPRDYSIPGDVNLDGVLSGNGTGPASTDDVTAFIQGWNWQQTQANVTSWKKGDLNLDGVTNVNDFFLMRNALASAGLGVGAAALSTLFTSGGVPEPSSLALAVGAIGFALGRRRPRTRQIA